MTKTREELEAKLASKSRGELVDLIFSLTTFDQLLTAREIAERSHVSKRDVLQAMKAGAFVDVFFGRGFFCRASNSLRVSIAAANAWRGSFFVPVDSIPGYKKDCAGSQIVLGGKNVGQKAIPFGRRTVRELSPAFLAGNGTK